MIEVRVKFFAFAHDLTGVDEMVLHSEPNPTTLSILDQLTVKFPQLKAWKDHLRVAVNCEYVSLNHVLQNGDEVAIIPPVSGG